MEIHILNDSANTLYCQTVQSMTSVWMYGIVPSVVAIVILFFLTRLYGRQRILAAVLSTIVIGLLGWTLISVYSAGQLVREFEMRTDQNKLIVQAFYKRDNSYMGTPTILPLEEVASADIEQTRNGARIVFTLRNGQLLYPLGSEPSSIGNGFLILARVREHLAARQTP